MAHFLLSQSKHYYPEFKNFPSTHEVHFAVVSHYLQSELQGISHILSLVLQVAQIVLSQAGQSLFFK